MKQVVFNPKAVDDLDEITAFIAAENPEASLRVREAILDVAELTGKSPGLAALPILALLGFKAFASFP